uniref:DM domain-containing protein n=1 Tax=Syphacia muris TaxID=451379 RepID=A0A0N5AUA0_9BILA
MPKEQYMCQLCANHGIFNQPKKGHKQNCPHRHCPCNLCALNTKRRALDQIERQLKNGSSCSQKSELQLQKNEVTELRVFPLYSSASQLPEISNTQNGSTLDNLSSGTKTVRQITPLLRHSKNNINSSTSSAAFCVALPATITKKAIKRTAKRLDETGKKARILENTINSITQRKRHRSIFHSVEKLAQSG